MTFPPPIVVSANSTDSLKHNGPYPKSEAERFWPKVNKTDTCWIWTAGKNGIGYGSFRIGSVKDGTRRQILAHRWAYVEVNGPIPDGLVLDHLCRTPACVRPSHLEAISQQENLLRGIGISAQHAIKTHCPRGHEYRQRKDRNARWCPTCEYAQRKVRIR